MKRLLFSIFVLGTTACNSMPAPEPIIDPTPVESTAPSEEERLSLTQDLLISGDWGPQDSLGRYIEFRDDGTYTASLAGEGDGPEDGTYEIDGNEVLLTSDAGVAWGSGLTLGVDEDTLYYTTYLAYDADPWYWNRNAPVPAGSERTVDGHAVITVDSDADLKPEAAPKSAPAVDAPVYVFKFCGEGCDIGEVESFSGSFTGVLARTETQESFNEVKDYWYLVGVELGWYSAAILDGSTDGIKINYAWVHGSELQ